MFEFIIVGKYQYIHLNIYILYLHNSDAYELELL